MSPEEALRILVTMADRAPGNGADHRAVVEAADVLAQAIAEPDDAPG